MALSQTVTPNVSQNTGWNGQDPWHPGNPSAPPGQFGPAQAPPNTLGPTGYNPNAAGYGDTTNGQGRSGMAPGGLASVAGPGGPYNFQPTTGSSGTSSVMDPMGNVMSSPTYGQYGQGMNPNVAYQQGQQKFGLQNDINYGDYQRFGDISQQYGAAGQGILNDPRSSAALNNQANLAGGPSAGQLSAQSYNNAALNQLQNAAAGNGPTAADIQSQRGVSEAMRAQLTAAASARGGAYAQAAAQQNAAAQASGIQAGAVGQAAQLRAQEQQQAQSAFAGAAGQYAGAQNQALMAQTNAAQAYQQGVLANQNLGMGYYTGQQQAYQHQSDIASNLASNQVANDYGLSGTQLQTQTQQHIADQQQQQANTGAALAAGGMVLAAALSTGGAQAAAKGAREHGADEHTAAQIGAHVGQAIGHARAGSLAAHFQMQDTEAAKRGAMTPAEMHAHLAKLRAKGKKQAPLPGPSTEPEAAHAYAVGSHMAMLAKMHQQKRAHVTR